MDLEGKPVGEIRRLSLRDALKSEKTLCYRLGLCILLFVVNLSLTVWAVFWPQERYVVAQNPGGSSGDENHAYSMAILYQGDCHFVQNLDTVMHLILNVISSLMLWSTSACIQILNSPTRNELDRAHSCMRWMDVGVPSLRNIRKKSRVHVIFWCIFIFTTSLLHLFWNSAIFSSLPTSAYSAAITTSHFDTNLKPWNPGANPNLQTSGLTFGHLDNKDCIQRYIQPFNQGMDLVVVTSAENNSMSYNDGTSLIYDFSVPGGVSWTDGNDWLCSGIGNSEMYCNGNLLEKNYGNWTFKWQNATGSNFYLPILYCQSNGIHNLNDSCRLYCSFPILWAVCTINLIQCFCIYYTLRSQVEKRALICIGDVIASYLQTPEEKSKGMCMLSKSDVTQSLTPWPEGPRQWCPKKGQRWYEAVGRVPFFTLCIFMLIIVIIIVAKMTEAILSLSWYGLRSRIGIQDIFSYGLGQPQVFTMVETFAKYQIGGLPTPRTFLASVLLANAPQLVASIVYQLVFSQFCSMLVAVEWNQFSGAPIKPHWWKWSSIRAALARPFKRVVPDRGAPSGRGEFVPLRQISESGLSNLLPSVPRSTLRVSYPEKWQRPSYQMSIPYRFAFCYTLLAGGVHWALSQSLFVVVTISFDANQERNPQDDACNVGWSYEGWIVSGVFILVTLVMFLAVGMRRFSSGKYQMPLASTCSIAISAACHRPPDEHDAHLYSLQWGDIVPSSPGHGVGEAEDNVGHCCFTTSLHVKPPTLGRFYE